MNEFRDNSFSDRLDDLNLTALNSQLQEWLISGQVVVDQASGIEVSEQDKGIVLETASFAQSEANGVVDGGVRGACRIVAPSVAGELKKTGLASETKYYLFEEIWHPAIVATVPTAAGEQKAFIDVGMRKPIPIAIPITGREVSTDFYRQFGKGTMSYVCEDVKDGLSLSIFADGQKRGQIGYRRMEPKDEIPVFTEGFKAALNATLTRTTFKGDKMLIEPVGDNLQGVQRAMESGDPEVRLTYGGKAMGVING